MSKISPIFDGELGASVRTKMNTAMKDLSGEQIETLGNVQGGAQEREMLVNKSGVYVPTNIPGYTIPAYCGYILPLPIQLTPTPTVIETWVLDSPSEGITVSNGEFTVAQDGRYKIDLERIYRNDDRNPGNIIYVTITTQVNTGVGYTDYFTRTAPISAATANNEPSILSFSTPFNLQITAGSKFRILVSAEELGGATPSDCYLISSTVVANLVGELA